MPGTSLLTQGRRQGNEITAWQSISTQLVRPLTLYLGILWQVTRDGDPLSAGAGGRGVSTRRPARGHPAVPPALPQQPRRDRRPGPQGTRRRPGGVELPVLPQRQEAAPRGVVGRLRHHALPHHDAAPHRRPPARALLPLHGPATSLHQRGRPGTGRRIV